MGKKATALEVPPPRDAIDCNEFIYNVGELQRMLTRLETDLNDRIAKAKADAEQAAEPFRQRLASRVAGIQAYCDANRSKLTSDGKTKTYRFGSGEVSWRTAPASVSISKKVKAEGVVAWLLEAPAKFRRFLRPKHEVNKEAMLAAPELAAEIPGIKIKSGGEAFYVKPFETELEEVA